MEAIRNFSPSQSEALSLINAHLCSIEAPINAHASSVHGLFFNPNLTIKKGILVVSYLVRFF